MGKKWNKCKTDLDQLRVDIRNMSCRSNLYKVLEEELTPLGHWRQKARWYPMDFVSNKNEKDI